MANIYGRGSEIYVFIYRRVTFGKRGEYLQTRIQNLDIHWRARHSWLLCRLFLDGYPESNTY